MAIQKYEGSDWLFARYESWLTHYSCISVLNTIINNNDEIILYCYFKTVALDLKAYLSGMQSVYKTQTNLSNILPILEYFKL